MDHSRTYSSASILGARPLPSSKGIKNNSSSSAGGAVPASYYSLRKCTDLPQYYALQMAAQTFRNEPKLHLRQLLSDAFRCQGLMAIHKTSRVFEEGGSSTASAANNNNNNNNTSATTAAMGNSSTAPTDETTATTAATTMRRWDTANPQQRKLILDYSRQHVTGETMELLFDLADNMSLTERISQMRYGGVVNNTQKLCALHHMLRLPISYYDNNNNNSSGCTSSNNDNNSNNSSNNQAKTSPQQQQMQQILTDIHSSLDKIQSYSNNVRNGSINGCTGLNFSTIVCIGMGSAHTTTQAVYEALLGDVHAYTATANTTTRMSLRFIADVDPVEFDVNTRDLHPETTLFVVTSATFDDSSATVDGSSSGGGGGSLHNAKLAKRWLVRGLCGGSSVTTNNNGAAIVVDEDEAIAKHFIAVTLYPQEAIKFGISPGNIFTLWDWASDRFALWTAAGLLPLSIHYSFDVIRRLLDGAHDIDEHFFDAPLGGNIPVLLGLLGVWNSTFMGYHSRCILPYSFALRSFPSVVQKFDMGCNGKSVTASGLPLNLHAGEINFGDSGSIGLHSYYQLLHQGRPVPADFIGFMESQCPYDEVDNTINTSNNSNNFLHSSSSGGGTPPLNDGGGGGDAINSEFDISGHDELMSNFFAQPDALANGKTMNDLIQEGVEDYLRPHKVFPGNRPSSSILMTKLDAFAIGQLLAIYEHRTIVQGFIWGLNPFDGYGTELGQANAMRVRAQLSARTSVQGFNSSSGFLLETYLSHGRASR